VRSIVFTATRGDVARSLRVIQAIL
jgi:hypothetical protein